MNDLVIDPYRFEHVKKVINDWDPMDLLEIGAPTDEYESEVEEIVKVLQDTIDANELAEEIKQVFVRYFSQSLGLSECKKAARAILDEIQ
ncbi:YugE family protein (plasmid) [Brevibacillus sp. M2.1A]|uniref:DUF1871 family protein n=1 Tax=Brevibacillus sp. M2.1A TaxID=2738980 RepID=UPI00156AD9A3|nr:DUF1871 family protein [Brevibacillus sp. M2.1A]MCC8438709.1 YugE family protein [Brevibacillus sp. M2.1A]